MKKLHIVLAILFITTLCNAQAVVKGTVKDIHTNEVLEYATITTADQRSHTISNAEGLFSLSCPAGTGSFFITYIGYAPLTIELSNLPTDDIYYLERQDVNLEEVIIMNTPIDDFISSLIKNSIRELSSPIVLNSYYREFVIFNDVYSKFSDGLVDYGVYKGDNEISTKLIVNQSRAEKLKDSDENNNIKVLGFDVGDGVNYTYNFTFLESALLKKRAYKNYDFTFRSYNSGSGEPLQIITFTPKKGVEKALYEGSIVYNNERNIIMNIDLKMSPAYRKYAKASNRLVLHMLLKDLAYKSAFRLVNGKYLLSYSSMYGKAHAWNRFNYDNLYAFKSDLIVNGHTDDLTDFENKKKYYGRDLYQRGNKYTDEYWTKNNSLLLTEKEEQIIQYIHNKQ